MDTAYSYIRFSTPEQRKGDSLRRQHQNAVAFCKQNGLQLDDSLKLRDLGVSAFKGRNATHGALSGFLAAVEEGRVKPGSVLIVESLDRLSRSEVLEALNLFTGILKSEVKIVTLIDRHEYTKDSVNGNPWDLMYSIMVMTRANEESAAKAKRVAAAWQEKRANGATKPLTAKCPGWLELDKKTGKFYLVPEKAALLKRVLKMAMDGMGAIAISQTLNREGVKTFTRKGKTWEFSTVQHLLRTRTLLGEYQPCRMVEGKPVATGEPIKGYYPALVSEEDFYRVQNVLASRKRNVKGRSGKTVANIFGRVLVSGHDGGTMVLSQKRAENLNIVSANANRGLSDYKKSFPYSAFERAFLEWVQEIDLSGLNNETHEHSRRVEELEGRLADLKVKIGKVKGVMKGSLETGQPIEHLAEVIQDFSVQERDTKRQLDEERGKMHRPEFQTSDVGKLLEEMNELPEHERSAVRAKLKLTIQNIVVKIKLYVYSRKMVRLALAHVSLRDGSQRVFIVRVERGTLPVSYSDAHKWEGTPTPFEHVDLMLQMGSPEGLWEMLENLHPWPVEMKPVPITHRQEDLEEALAAACPQLC